MKKNPTIRDVAKAAGFAVSTVSMGLRNDPSIPPATRERIREAAAGVGYRANPLVATLMANLRTMRASSQATVIALLHSHPRPEDRRRSPYYSRVVAGVFRRTEELGYKAEEFWIDPGQMSDRRLSGILHARGICGIVIAPSSMPGRMWSMEWPNVAAVAIGYTIKDPNLSRACANHFQSVSLAMEVLRSRGYGRIGLVLTLGTDERVRRTFRAAFLLGQQAFPPKNRVPALLAEEIGERQFRSWHAKHRPDAIIGGYEVMEWLAACKVKVPGECAFVLLDWNDNFKNCSGIDQHIDVVSAAAVDLVVEMLQKNERGIPAHPKTVMIESRWVEGGTVRPLSSAKSRLS